MKDKTSEIMSKEEVKKEFIEGLISKMSLEQKVGQCLVLGYVGTVITPEILRRIRTYYPAGIRAGFYWRMKSAFHDPSGINTDYLHRLIRKPKGTVKDFVPGLPVPHCTNEEYCSFLNTLKEAALDNDLSIPLHITFDAEGDRCDYYHGGMNYFPYFMGLAKTGDTKLVHDVTWAIAHQVKPLGFSWTHSLVLDVNTNPLNPEINIRSFGEDAETVIRFAKEALKGYREGSIISTGKHFPGRGACDSDAHAHMPTIDLSRKEMEEHLAPYRALIREGLPAIMTAHTAYPGLDRSGLPATLSKPIVTDLLKGEMNFRGVVTTDEMSMGGIIERFELSEACIRTLEAGCDLVLLREENSIIDEVFPALVKAVDSGRVPIERIEDAVNRTLSVKYDYGFFDKDSILDSQKAGNGIHDQRVATIARRSAEKVITILRDQNNILPLDGKTKVLLVEQVNPLHEVVNDQKCHPGIFWEKMLGYSENVGMVETHMLFTNDDKQRVKTRLDHAEVLVVTNYFSRRHSDGNDFIKELHTCGKPVIVVTNCPYPFTVCREYETVICTYSSSPQALEEAAKIIYGAR